MPSIAVTAAVTDDADRAELVLTTSANCAEAGNAVARCSVNVNGRAVSVSGVAVDALDKTRVVLSSASKVHYGDYVTVAYNRQGGTVTNGLHLFGDTATELTATAWAPGQGTSAALTIYHDAGTGATAATATVADDTLTLVITGGANAGTESLEFSRSPTLTQLVDAVNALGTGWTAVLIGTATAMSEAILARAAESAYGSANTLTLLRTDDARRVNNNVRVLRADTDKITRSQRTCPTKLRTVVTRAD